MARAFLLRVLGLMQSRQCQLPQCLCPHALLYLWHEGRELHYELRIRDGERRQGGALTLRDAVAYSEETLRERGLERMRLVFARPAEVPNA